MAPLPVGGDQSSHVWLLDADWVAGAKPGALRHVADRADGSPTILIGPTRAIAAAEFHFPGALSAKQSLPMRRTRLAQLIAAALGRTMPEAGNAAADAGQAWIAPSAEEADEAGASLLVVEDDKTNRVVIGRDLTRWGYHADIVESGAQALALFRPSKHGMLLTDLHMPEMDGVALAETMRRRPDGGGAIPIIALTADALPAAERRCREAGMNGFLAKPIESAALLACLETWLPQAAPLRRLAEPADSAVQHRFDGIDPSIFDTTRILEPFGGWNAEAASFLQDFLDDLPDKIGTLSSALADGDSNRAREAAHLLKGAARSAGAMRLGLNASDIQDSLEQDDIELARTIDSVLPVSYDEFQKTVSKMMKGFE
jgi:CheY-like chemotaxis protein/HPt (histidine-containing phosphotransfer) domain-containing protein